MRHNRYLFASVLGLVVFAFGAYRRSVVDAEFVEYGQSVTVPGIHVTPRPLPPAFSMTPEPDNAITLQRTRCYGACPAYVLRVESSGIVSFSPGPPFRPGELRTTTITTEQYRDLVSMFSAIHFSEFKDVYSPTATDLPEVYIQLTVDGKPKKIKHSNVSPSGLEDLERTIERLTNIHQWLHDASHQLTLQTPIRDVREVEDVKNEYVVSRDAYTRIKPGMTELMQTAGGGGLQAEIDAAQRRRQHPSRADVGQWIVAKLRTELNEGQSVNASDESGWTALMTAAILDRPESVSVLLDAGADIAQHDDHGDTPLIAAAAARNDDPTLAAATAKLLLAHGASPDSLNDKGETALMWAARSGNPDLIRVLLEAGANPSRLDRTGHDALFYLRKAREEMSFQPTLVKRYDEAESILNRN